MESGPWAPPPPAPLLFEVPVKQVAVGMSAGAQAGEEGAGGEAAEKGGV